MRLAFKPIFLRGVGTWPGGGGGGRLTIAIKIPAPADELIPEVFALQKEQ